jgi:hypothetical protein
VSVSEESKPGWANLPSGYYSGLTCDYEQLGLNLPPLVGTWVSTLLTRSPGSHQMVAVGTAFRVATLADQKALFLTAAHCFPDEMHTGGAELFVVVPLGANGNGGEAWASVTSAVMSSTFSDIALLRVDPPSPGPIPPNFVPATVGLDFTQPEPGDVCLALGYPIVNLANESHKDLACVGKVTLSASVGRVTDVYPSRSMPGFYIDAEAPAGMSGGPVVSTRNGGVVGIVTSGFDGVGEGSNLSFVSLLGTLAELTVDLETREGVTKAFGLQDLLSTGAIRPVTQEWTMQLTRDDRRVTLSWGDDPDVSANPKQDT